ncbi:uncharacterized protein LOC131430738 [Malaya genurostris]|uniref:uncharacterized protein LOC131430738 n=1 Tax=Malaya genurostris TaxID=325434 RepID=UPI0026F3C34F|nr:uncharacterized protein LOC131430738 [Malaya genurostris]
MPGKGENVPDGYFYQLYTLLYFICRFRRNAECTKYCIGNAIKKYGALDDVVLKVGPDGNQRIYALQVKQAQTDKKIDMNALTGKGENKFFVFKYFQSFLDIKEHVPLEELKEMIIWTHMDFAENVKHLIGKYSPGNSDLLTPEDYVFSYDRYRIVDFEQLSSDYLRKTHPFEALVGKFVSVLFRKEQWNSNGAAKGCYRIMAKEVIVCNGHNSKFRDEFIRGDEHLSQVTLLFREYFEGAMKRQFLKDKLGDFSMAQLNSEPYRKHFELKVDENFREGSNKQPMWKIGYIPTEQDLKDFFSRFVFYLNVPKLSTMKEFLARELHVSFEQFCNIVEKYSIHKFMNEQQVESIIKLLELREDMNKNIYSGLKFVERDLLELQNQIRNTKRFLYIEAPQDVECTVSRIRSILEGDIEAASKRFVVIDLSNSMKDLDGLLPIINDTGLCEHALKFVIIISPSFITSQEVVEKLVPSEVKVVFVAKQELPQQSDETVEKVKDKEAKLNGNERFKDEFDVGLLTQASKNDIKLREISLFGMATIKVDSLFSTDLFRKENFWLVLGLYRNRNNVTVGERLTSTDFFIRREMKDNLNNAVDLVNENGPNRVVISDQTGMGKTTELINLTVQLRERYPRRLVVFLDCLSAVNSFKTNFVETIGEVVCGSNLLGRHIVKEMFHQEKVMIVLDALDEVSDADDEKLKKLLIGASLVDVSKLCISSKPYREKFIIDVLTDCKICKLDHFSPENQREYLRKFWRVEEIQQNEERAIIEHNVESIINKFRNIFRDNFLLGVPLQTAMIAEIYQENICEREFVVPQAYEIGGVVERFVDEKLRRFCSKTFKSASKAHDTVMHNLTEPVLRSHLKLAVNLFRRSYHIKRRTSDDAISKEIDKQQVYGLVQLRPSEGFIHQIYLDYFLTLYMLTYSVNEKLFKLFMKRIFCKSRKDLAIRFLDYHIGCIAPDKALESDEHDSGHPSEREQFEVPSTVRIHPDKIWELNFFLRTYCTGSEIFTFIRNSLNASVFNVFEVMYDSLPESMKTKLEFCFGAQPENYFINLKPCGENHILQLLTILRKKNPDNFVRRYLVNFGDEDEDFLAIACRKPFMEVLKMFIELKANINEDEYHSLKDYVFRRIIRYLELVVQHNNSQLLKFVIDWVMKTKSKEGSKSILNEKDILLEFVKNVQVKVETKDFLEHNRIEMIESFHSLYKWSYDDSYVLSDGCIDKIRNISNRGILDAFSKTFLTV